MIQNKLIPEMFLFRNVFIAIIYAKYHAVHLEFEMYFQCKDVRVAGVVGGQISPYGNYMRVEMI